MARVEELDGIRGVAILLVVGCHYPGFSWLLWKLPRFGWVGVDIFFTLSGYLITSMLLQLREHENPLKVFYGRRFTRTLPPYAAATLICLAGAFLFNQRDPYFLRQLLRNIFFLQAFRNPKEVVYLVRHLDTFSLPNLMAHAGRLRATHAGFTPPISRANGICWSLSVEEWFYILWAPVVLFLRRRTILSIAAAICLGEIGVRWACFTGYGDYMSIYHRFDALIYGAFLAMLLSVPSRWTGPQRAPMSRVLGLGLLAALTGLGSILIAIRPILGLEIRESPLFLVFGLPMVSLATFCAVGLLIVNSGSALPYCRAMRWSFLRWIGTISYSMYLIHLIVYAGAAWTLRHLHPGGARTPLGLLLLATCALGLTLLASHLSWVYFESRILRWKEERFPTAPPPPAAAAL